MSYTSAADVCRYWLNEFADALTECDRPEPKTRYVGAGQVSYDDCCGMLVVSPENIFRWTTFPVPETDIERCISGLLGVSLLVTLVRCVPTQSSTGRPPQPSALDAAYTGLLLDAAVIFDRATGELPEGWERSAVDQIFAGPGGGCVGVETRLTVGLDQERWLCCEVEDV